MELQPYIFFYGKCEEALEFYKRALGGTYEMQRNSESGMAGHMPPDAGNRVMHASFTAGNLKFMASDGRDVKAIDPDAGNITLSIEGSDRAEGQRVFDALSQGGKVDMPFEDAPWGDGGKFGMITDRFGIEWMVVSP